MKRAFIAIVLVVFGSASYQTCRAQTNVTSICLPGWNALSSTNVHPVKLSWSYNAANADGVGIERSTSANGPWMLIGIVSSTVTNFTDQTVSCAMSYWYRVYAYNETGDSGYSNTAGPAIEAPCL